MWMCNTSSIFFKISFFFKKSQSIPLPRVQDFTALRGPWMEQCTMQSLIGTLLYNLRLDRKCHLKKVPVFKNCCQVKSSYYSSYSPWFLHKEEVYGLQSGKRWDEWDSVDTKHIHWMYPWLCHSAALKENYIHNTNNFCFTPSERPDIQNSPYAITFLTIIQVYHFCNKLPMLWM